MTKSIQTSKVVAAVVGLGLAASLLLGVSANVASAQSMTLAQLVNLFISLGIIPPSEAAAAQAAIANSSATTPAASSHTYSTDLTVGSSGADVTALQGVLGVSPATGYFGAITKAAVMKYQAANGLPSTGYVGSLTRAKLNGSGSSMTTTTTTTTSNGSTSSTVTNTGVEGVLTVNLNSTPSSGQNVYEGDSKDGLLGIKLQAQLSPIDIQRVQVDLGNSSNFYTKYFSNLYLVSDTGQVLAQAALNPNTVTKQTSSGSNEYYLTFSGFNYTVPGDNSVHVLTVEADLYSSIDTSLNGTAIPVVIDANGIRGVDGAGVDQYGPTSGTLSNSVTLQGSLSSSAQLQLSTDPSTPLTTSAVASQGSASNELDGQTALVFDLYAQKDWIQLDNLTTGIYNSNESTGGSATATTAYLYAGSQQISSAAISYNATGIYGTANFQNINYKIAQNTTQPFTIKVDVKSANSSTKTFYATVTQSYILAENSQGNTLYVSGSTGASGNPTVSGSATGNPISVNSGGPVFSLVGSPTITTGATPVIANNSTSTLQAVFNVQIQALGSNVYFADQTASSTFVVGLYLNGAETASPALVASSTSVSVPSNGVVTTGLPYQTGLSTGADGTAFELQQNNTVTIPVTFNMQGRVSSSGASITYGSYAIGLDSITWSLAGTGSTVTSSFMKGQTSWRTPTAQNFP